MKSIRQLSALLGSAVLILFFQNCGGVNFQASDFQSTKALGESDPVDQTEHSEGEFIESNEANETNQCGDDSDGLSEGLPHEGGNLDEVLGNNAACTQLFARLDAAALPAQDKVKIVGIKGNIFVANANRLFIAGLSKNIAAKNIGQAEILGIHGSVCLQAEEVSLISGLITGTKADVAIIGPDNGLGHAPQLTGVTKSDLVLVNYEVDQIIGIGKSLHIFGGRIHQLKGIFGEIHLYNGATIDNIQSIKQSVVVH